MRKLLLSLTVAAATIIMSPAARAEDKVLTIYTYESFTADWGPGPKVKAAF